MIKKICENVWKVDVDSNVYFLDFDEKIVIDTGRRMNRNILEQFLGKVVDFEKIEKIVFTHMHFDHVGNFDLFPNAAFFASREEIGCFEKDPAAATLNEDIVEKLKAARIKLSVLEKLKGLEIIHTPGHTIGSICLWYAAERVLFSGDTIFKDGPGRTDLPTSAPGKLQASLNKLVSYNFKILCPGHG
jgi:glyoxylase-like metal-dependent hydrolase (beta-lactamase superfamily II)